MCKCAVCGVELMNTHELREHVTSKEGHDMIWYDYMSKYNASVRYE